MVRSFLAVISWPLLFALCLLTTGYGFAIGHPILGFNLTYIALGLILFALERSMPHEPAWNAYDGQLPADLAHTLLNKGMVQALVAFSAVIGLASIATHADQPGYGIWPRHWPIAVQVIMGTVIAEFSLYWAHRLGHEWRWLWRFHAVHHSVTRLWILNTGRFHFVDSLKSVVIGMATLLALGAPEEVLTWLAAITAFIGILTHCNVEMRTGWLNYIFNTPALHRWHHSRDMAEGNSNYGENLMLFDLIFRSFLLPSRRPPRDIGIDEPMPDRFVQQLIHPFRPMTNGVTLADR